MRPFLHRLIITRSNWIWLLLIAPLPSCLIILHGYYRLYQLEELANTTQIIHKKILYNELIQKKEEKILSQLKLSDPQYLDKYVESLCFLQPEQKKLQALLLENRLDPISSQRLNWISQENHLAFFEEKIRKHLLFCEVEERQQKTIQANEEDLKQLLCFVEQVHIWPYGPKPGVPFLFITDFNLMKKSITPQQKVFCIDMKLVKREAL
ncbi:hypothetical protein RHABOEDO_000149 [Candidatus Rhabdochlamydia oedothoracis]|uniref:Uncharacterized protein n=1 Tax=Candidatus Rhabdochlamydia oedothoracis TaxID=2720720 RepID=A0ABX8UYL6_9BACT|nr:hypothetical protein [Candidatus Rhabdochlamydia sp. W815]KAG6559397.1 hypothetical protein RHOW815_000598 [Candidatus Rhabdochlamydia sp. W815]MCL6755758.1 hypothetical protein [Candidatus Rhabdochlamydia oedothoracis]QYF48058.1 hypothetical protein RHABOEDO_000149 [Candidatus Rhabdochlamydia oedothoracis]